MKYLLSLIVLLCSVPSTAQLTNGLIAHWDFNGNANDITANGHNGTANNVTYTTGKLGAATSAALFNGMNSYVIVPYQSSLNITNYSICALVKPMGYYTGTCQVNNILGRGTEYQPGAYRLAFFDNAFDNHSCTITDTSKNVFITNTNQPVSNPNTTFRYTPTIVTTNWYCVVGTYDGSAFRIYVNGVLMSTSNVTGGAIGSSVEGLAIGANRFGSFTSFPYWYNGIIDDLRLYNRALSQLEIDSFCNLFNSPATTPDVSISQPVSPTSFCPSDNFVLHYTVTGPFNTGNIFTAQLSDATGSFGTPVNIGSVTATGAGTINCTIPANTPQGTGYRVRVTASNPSKTSADNGINLTVFDAPKIILSGDTAVCIGDTLRFFAQVTPSSAKITWTGPNGFGATTANVFIPGADYTDTGRYVINADNGGCIARDTITAVVGSVDFKLGNDTTICKGDVLILSPGIAGAQYYWQDGNTGYSYYASIAGSYHVRVSLGSCFKQDTINIGVQSAEIQLPADTVLCKDAQFIISVADTFDSYAWNTGSTQSSVTIGNGGLYALRVTKGLCSAADTMKVELLEPYFILGNDTTLCNGRTLTLKPGSIEGSSYYWQDGSTKDFFTVKEKGVYHVTATNICGTFGSNIQVDYIQCECNPIMPNAFTPNKDGLNDAIGPILTCIPAEFKFIIANRWGEIVFETDDYQKKWDGRHTSIPAELGTYFYLIQTTDMLGNKATHKGDILLLR